MFSLPRAASRFFAALTGLLLCATLSPPAYSATVLDNLKATPGVSAADILPAASKPRAYRQTVIATCNSSTPSLGSNLCILSFDKVPAASVLQIDLIQCSLNGNGGLILFNSQLKVDTVHVLGLVKARVSPSTVAEAHGPFFLKAGETPKLFTNGTSPTDTVLCLMTGSVSTN